MALSPNHMSRNYSSPIFSPTKNTEIPKPFFIGVCGGPASGKTEVCDKITGKLEEIAKAENLGQRVAVVNMDSFYKKLTPENLERAKNGTYNFDHPDAFDDEAMYKALVKIQQGEPVTVSSYDYVNNQPNANDTKEIAKADVVLVEGILVFYYEKILDLFNLKLFVETDSESRLVKRSKYNILTFDA